MAHNKFFLAHLGCTTLLALGALPSAQAQTETFNIQSFVIKGASLLNKTEIAEATRSFTGNNKVYGDIQKAVEALEALYRQKGYSAVDVFVPEQDITQGNVDIKVQEARIGKVQVTGNKHFDNANILASLPELAPGQPPNVRKLSENVQLANSNPSKQVDAVLSASETEGTLDAKVTVTDQNPLRFVVNADNSGSNDGPLGKHRMGFAVQHANLWGLDHVATFSYGTSPKALSDLRSLSLSYRVPFYGLGDSADLILGDSKVSTATPTQGGLIPLQFTGIGKVIGLRYTHNFARRGEYSSKLIAGFDQRIYDNTCELNGSNLSSSGCTDHTVRPISLAYNGQILQPGSLIDYNLSLTQNLPGASNGDQAAITKAKEGAKENYRILRVNASWFGQVIGAWQGRAALAGQFSADPLISGESFGVAGSSAVRGFAERAVATDLGAVLNSEIYTPNLNELTRLNTLIGEANLRALAFVDVGYGKNQGTIVAPQYQQKLIASTGIGLRFDYRRDLNLRWDTAVVIKEGPPGTEEKGEWRTAFSLLLSF